MCGRSAGSDPRNVLVVSHGMYKDQPGIPTVLTMPVLAARVMI
jgi:hypothetical protein